MLKMQSSARRKAYITAMKLLMGVAAVLTCELVGGMIGYILGNGIPNVTWRCSPPRRAILPAASASCRTS